MSVLVSFMGASLYMYIGYGHGVWCRFIGCCVSALHGLEDLLNQDTHLFLPTMYQVSIARVEK